MRFRILGPLEVFGGGGQRVPLRAAKQRTILAMLLLNANSRVSVDRLMATAWPGLPPPSAPGLVRTYMSALRQALQLSSEGGPPRLWSDRGGYQLDLAPADLDLLTFEALEQRGRAALTDGDHAGAARLLQDALSLWRGRPAEDVTVDHEGVALLAGLEERRLRAEEAWADAWLAQGHDADLIDRLRTMVAEQPLREQRWHRMMEALYRTGRRADALAAFQDMRRRFVEEMGIEPGPQVQRLQRQILAGDAADGRPADPAPSAAVSSSAARPRQLPPDIAGFTGRTAELGHMTALLPATGQAHGPHGPVLLAISGMAGVGKTALAVHWAHQVADQFGDAQLYINLAGQAAAPPLDPRQALAQFLRALGTPPERVPDDLHEAAAMYRSLLDGQRVLVVLDNAENAGQVRPLLPGSAGCLVLITSRSRLSGLHVREGVTGIILDPLPEEDALALLRARLGAQQVDADPAAALRVAALCAFLPLALRIAAEHAAARPRLRLADLAAQLTATGQRLNVLDISDDAECQIRAVFSWSYGSLAAGPARVFRLLGLHTGTDISIQAAGALAAETEPEVRGHLAALTGVSLLEESTPGRYQFHDLLRAYAAERAQAEESAAGRKAAVVRMLYWYLHAVIAASRHLAPAAPTWVSAGRPPRHCAPPVFTSYQHALTWHDAEHANGVAAVRQAASLNEQAITWKLAVSLWTYFDLRKPWTDWLGCASIALDAARRTGYRHGEFMALSFLGAAHDGLRHYDDALDCCLQAVTICHETGDPQDSWAALNNLGAAYWSLRRFEDALSCHQQVLAMARQSGNRYAEGVALDNLGETLRVLHRPGEALACHREALAIATETSDQLGAGNALHNLGQAYAALHRPGEAREYYQRALGLRGETGDRRGTAETHRDLGDLLSDGGQLAEARQSWEQAAAIFDVLGDPQADDVRHRFVERAANATGIA